MKYVMQAFAVAGLLGAAVVPALAQDSKMDPSKMTCADLKAMDKAGQMEAMSQMEMAAAKSDGKEMTSDDAKMSGEKMMPGTMTACDGHPDMMAMDAMHSGM